MSQDVIRIVNEVIVPAGLALIMFSLGLTLRLADFTFVARARRAVVAGVSAHMLLLPLLGLLICWMFGLEGELALAVFIISICPTGTTSNALTFIGGGNVALAVVLTAISSIVTVITIPLLLSWSIPFFMEGSANLPQISMIDTIGKLVRITLLPIALGMIVHSRYPVFSASLAGKLKPASFIILAGMIAFSIAISLDMVLRNLAAIGPAMFALNVLALACGLLIGRLLSIGARDQMTLAIEVGVQNVTLALFLTGTVLGSLELSVSQNIYGVLMLANAAILIRLFRGRIAREKAASPVPHPAGAA